MTKVESEAASRALRETARFLVDENVPPELTRLLTERGYNAKSVSDIGMRGRSDEDVLARALRDNRLLITNDDDFREERRFPEHRNPGIVIIPNGPLTDDGVITALSSMLPLVGKHRGLFAGAVVQVDRDGVLAVTSRDLDSGARVTTRYKYSSAGEFYWDVE
jgi:predicted nuclease of predicted toxin-antitoxin system